jgi:hypothetical protein
VTAERWSRSRRRCACRSSHSPFSAALRSPRAISPRPGYRMPPAPTRACWPRVNRLNSWHPWAAPKARRARDRAARPRRRDRSKLSARPWLPARNCSAMSGHAAPRRGRQCHDPASRATGPGTGRSWHARRRATGQHAAADASARPGLIWAFHQRFRASADLSARRSSHRLGVPGRQRALQRRA